jgi:beta-galactosidase
LLSASRPDGELSRDLTVFVDDDSTAYLLHASQADNSTMEIVPLSTDYLTPLAGFTSLFVGQSWEAPAIFKWAGKYYLVASGSTGWAPNAAHAAVADAILGPWTDLGNPAMGPGAFNTFAAQDTFVFPVVDQPGAFVLMADRWSKWDLSSSRYLWLPVAFTPAGFALPWTASWTPSATPP